MSGARKKNLEKASASRFNSSLRELVDANYHSLESRDPADIQLFLVLFQPLRRTAISSLLWYATSTLLRAGTHPHPPPPSSSSSSSSLTLSPYLRRTTQPRQGGFHFSETSSSSSSHGVKARRLCLKTVRHVPRVHEMGCNLQVVGALRVGACTV